MNQMICVVSSVIICQGCNHYNPHERDENCDSDFCHPRVRSCAPVYCITVSDEEPI